MPKEGKSFVAANLAQVMVRQHGRRALVIDGDLRELRAAPAPGNSSRRRDLAEYLLGECDEFAALQRGPMENLFFMPAGRTVSSAPELLANGRLKLFLQRVEPLFDWIILDSSPAIPVSDATLIAASSCDGVLMVVRSNATPSDLARNAREEFPDKFLFGVVLNGATKDSKHSKYYYGEAVNKPRQEGGTEVVELIRLFQCLLPDSHAGPAAGRGPDCLDLVPAGSLGAATGRQLYRAYLRSRRYYKIFMFTRWCWCVLIGSIFTIPPG